MVQADVRHGNGSIGVHVEGPNELSPEDAVVLNTLSYAYSGHRPIVSDISLSLPKGSRCLLLGANGAGEACLCKAASLSPQVLKLPKETEFQCPALWYAKAQILHYSGAKWSYSVVQACAGVL